MSGDVIHNHFYGRKPPGQHRRDGLPGIDADEWHDALDADRHPPAEFFRNETLEQFIHRFDALEQAVTAFIDAQPAIDAVVTELTNARTEIATLKAEAAAKDTQTINLQPLQDIASGIASDVAPAAAAPVEPAPAVDENGQPVIQ